MAKLQFIGGKMEGQVIELKEAKQVIGNRRTAEIAVREPWISWDHASITFDGGKFLIEDMGSKTGTFVNGTKIAGKTELKEGDKLAFGAAPQETLANFFLAGGPAAAAAPAAKPAEKPADKPVPSKVEGPAAAPAPAAAAAAAGAAVAGAASAAELNALKDKLARAEIDLRNAVRDLKTRDGEIERLKKELESAKAAGGGGGAAPSAETAALEKALEEQAKIIEEKEGMIAALEAEKLDLEKAAATGGVMAAVAGAEGGAEVEALKEALATAESEAKDAKRESSKLEKQLERKEQEIERLKDQAGAGAVSDVVEGDAAALEAKVLDLTSQLDQLNAENLEFKESIEKLTNRLRDVSEKDRSKKSSLEAQMTAMEEKVGEYLEAKHGAEKELERFKKEYSEFEERVIELQAQVDDLTEKNDIMAYKLEQADQQVGELVRTKIADMQVKYDETTQANQQLKSLIEALEEKVNELDERMEEMEAENAELEKLLDEEKKTHEAAKVEAEKQIRALKKRLQVAATDGGKGAKEPEEQETAAE